MSNCPGCGTELKCLAGHPVHPDNWYCPNDSCDMKTLVHPQNNSGFVKESDSVLSREDIFLLESFKALGKYSETVTSRVNRAKNLAHSLMKISNDLKKGS